MAVENSHQNQLVEILQPEGVKRYPLQWVEKILPLNSLRPFEHNPRTITETQYGKLKDSLREDGYHSRIKSTHDLRVIGGHQRLRALQELGYFTVPVLVADRPIPDAQFRRIVLRDNHNNGVFDMDMLSAMFDLEELREIGLHDVMNIPPLFEEDDKPPGVVVCCPQCGTQFPVKGNKA